MAALYPFSNKTAQRLRVPPAAGDTHRWLAQAANGLRTALPSDGCTRFLRMCCDRFVRHREVPDREIAAAVALAYGGQTSAMGQRKCGPAKPKPNYGERALDWPEVNDELMGRTLGERDACFDVDADSNLTTAGVLPSLFDPGELVCTGRICEKAVIRPLEAVLGDADQMQFIVVNPMKGPHALNQQGRISPRCQNNILRRRHIVAEFDDPTLPKAGQAILASALGSIAPLVLAVDSGGKSLHAWYRVEGMSVQDQARFFAQACLLGADRTRWDVCGWLRMPGGMRVKADGSKVRQRILYWKKG